MAQFAYKGIDSSGKAVTGVIDAVDRRKAVLELSSRGHFASEIIEKAGAAVMSAGRTETAGVRAVALSRGGRINEKDVVAMTGQLSTALRAGLPIINAIEIIAQQQQKPPMRSLLEDLAHDVKAGESLSESMRKHPQVFDTLYVSMVQVGETGGILDQTVIQLSRLLGREQKIKTNMKNALMYPAFVLAAGILSVIIMLTVVFPKMMATIGGSVTLMPLPTRVLLAMSDFLSNWTGLVFAGVVVAAGVAFHRWRQSPSGRLAWDTWTLKVPILGGVLRAIAVGRFARTLGALAKSGINILPALAVVRDTLGNELLGREVDTVAEKVKTGQPLAEPLAESGLFPPLLVQIVNIGEQTGTIDELLLNAADTFDEEADTAVTRFMAVFPALLILVLALIIGFIIFATLLPILSMDLGGMGV